MTVQLVVKVWYMLVMRLLLNVTEAIEESLIGICAQHL